MKDKALSLAIVGTRQTCTSVRQEWLIWIIPPILWLGFNHSPGTIYVWWQQTGLETAVESKLQLTQHVSSKNSLRHKLTAYSNCLAFSLRTTNYSYNRPYSISIWGAPGADPGFSNRRGAKDYVPATYLYKGWARSPLITAWKLYGFRCSLMLSESYFKHSETKQGEKNPLNKTSQNIFDPHLKGARACCAPAWSWLGSGVNVKAGESITSGSLLNPTYPHNLVLRRGLKRCLSLFNVPYYLIS